MKVLRIAALTCLLAGGVASAQEKEATPTLPEAPGVTVLQNKWRREVRHPALDEDPFRAGRDATQLEQGKKETMRENAINKQLGRDVVALPSEQPALVSARGPSPRYIYEAKIMNSGTKIIRALVWDYVFFDPNTQQDAGRHQYRSEISLRPGKTKNLVGFSQSPQTGVVDVMKTGTKLQRQYAERVVISRIEYADGSVWQRDLKK